MRDDVDRGGIVISKGRGPLKRSFGTPMQRNGRNFSVVGGNDDVIEKTALSRCGDRPRDHGSTAKVLDVLPRYALAAAARGDHCNIHGRIFCSVAMTTSCCCSVSVAYIGKLNASP